MMCNPIPTLALYLMSKPFEEKPSNSLSSTIVVPDLSGSRFEPFLESTIWLFVSIPFFTSNKSHERVFKPNVKLISSVVEQDI